MPLTLDQAKVGMSDKVAQTVIDEFQRASFILDKLTFDDAVSPGTGGSTLTYGYTRLKTPSVAEGRAINSEYKAGEAIKDKATCDLKVFGGSFEVDRVLEKSAAQSEIAFQLKQKVEATRNKFHYDFINGKSTAKGDNTSFNGLSELVKGTSTEHTPKATIDLSDVTKIKTNMDAFTFEFDQWLATLDGQPTMLAMNATMLTIMRFIAKEKGYYSHDEDAFGRTADFYNGIRMVDLGKYYDKAKNKTVDCVGIDDTTGETSIYAVTLGLDAVHGVSIKGGNIIDTYLPDMNAPGAVKKGEVEMVAAIALKNTKKAGAFRKIKARATA